MKSQDYIAMKDILEKNFNNQEWVPLRQFFFKKKGERSHIGFQIDQIDCISLITPMKNIEVIKKNIEHPTDYPHKGLLGDNDIYLPADIDVCNDFECSNLKSVHLVLSQEIDDETNVWHLHQDLVMTFNLTRKDNTWITQQGEEFAKLTVEKNNQPNKLEIKSSFLKEYLYIRKMSLCIRHFYRRSMITNDKSNIKNILDMPNIARIEYQDDIDLYEYENNVGKFECRIKKMSAVPSKNGAFKEALDISCTFERIDIIEPGNYSPNILHKEFPVYFFIDIDGNKVCKKEFMDTYSSSYGRPPKKWLWFESNIINILQNNEREFFLSPSWYNHVFKLTCSKYKILFGVNNDGHINVWAKDIFQLPEQEQKIWNSCNIKPTDNICEALQQKEEFGYWLKEDCHNAPEKLLLESIKTINELSQLKFKIDLFKNYSDLSILEKKIHRFRVIDKETLCFLAKDIVKLTLERLDKKSIRQPKKSSNLTILKEFLMRHNNEEEIQRAMRPFYCVSDLRNIDAHLVRPSKQKNYEQAIEKLDIHESQAFVWQGYQMLSKITESLKNIEEILKNIPIE